MRDGLLGIEFAIAQGLGYPDRAFDELWSAAEVHLDRRPLVARRVARCRHAVSLAALGDLERARGQLIELGRLEPPTDATSDDELAAAAAVAVLAGSEDEAERLVAQVQDRDRVLPSVDHLALFYVLRPEWRARYDALDLEGVHAQRRELAGALVAAREGNPGLLARFAWPPDAVVRWFAPAPWLVEALVVSAAAGGAPPAGLLQRLGPGQRHVLRRLGASSVPEVAAASVDLIALLGPAAPDRVEVRMLGSLEVDVGGELSAAAELRRERVRSLLGLLVLCRSIRRTEAAAALWPDLEEEAAAPQLAGHAHASAQAHRTASGEGDSFVLHRARARAADVA